MELLTILTLIILIGFIIVALMLFHQFNKNLTQFERAVNNKLDGSLRSASLEMSGKLDSAVKAVSDVHEHLGKLQESHRKIYDIGKDISSLQDLLRAPKIRGGIGELFLEDLINQIIPKEYISLQHEFKSKVRVDAVIKFGQGLVPIDAKFPLENFRKFVAAQGETEKTSFRKLFLNDVKTHIKNISEKYIQPDEGTFDFALMYIPAENVYYETIIKDDSLDGGGLFQYALTKKVIPVSPNSFYAYLRVILLGLKGMAVEKGAKEIIQNLGKLRNELRHFYEDFTKVGKHLSNSRACYDLAERHINKLADKLDQIESPSTSKSTFRIPE
ncbi:MAG: DNA recombination protein RmuC [Candidatus Omnitrophica bacterium]|nr:DNA recombination protein RmuC [Candidatus Omnitrophota bacterium]